MEGRCRLEAPHTALSPSAKRLAAAARLAKELVVDAAQERKRLRRLLGRRKGRTSRVRAWVEPRRPPLASCSPPLQLAATQAASKRATVAAAGAAALPPCPL